ncbi:MAG: GNAT family N-acetyltransferase [Planctomycetota bacterium]
MGEATLKSGERMTIKLVVLPHEDYAQKLCHFLEHKSDNQFRGIRQRLQAKYVKHCIDKYFIGEVGGQIVGQAWYGVPRGRTGIGNFGHVYTEPCYRRKGITTEIMKILVEDFAKEENAKCVLCSAGESAGIIYEKFGFQFIVPGAKSGGMALIKKSVAKDFAELEKKYFAPGLAVHVREGNIGDRHDCDRMLDLSQGMKELRARWHTAFIAHKVPSFMDALFCVEDGKGFTTVMESSEGRIMGYAFVLNLGSWFEDDFKVMDFVLHPNYLPRAAFFVRETVKIAQMAKMPDVYAFVASCDCEKMAAFCDAGFRDEYRFAGKFAIGQECHDIIALRFR